MTTTARIARPNQPDGIGLATMPIGINHIESQRRHHRRRRLRDPGGLRHVDPGEPDDGLAVLRHALNTRGYVLDDIARMILIHAQQNDHYGMAGRFMDLHGAPQSGPRTPTTDLQGLRKVPPSSDRPRRESATPTVTTGCPRMKCPPSPTPSSHGCRTSIPWSKRRPASTAARSSR